jgi:NAD(P)H-dependent FMN reductase
VAKPALQVIIGSTRPGRVGPAVADWIIERARAQGGSEVVVTDLAAVVMLGELARYAEALRPLRHA